MKLALFEAALTVGVVCAIVLWAGGQSMEPPALGVAATHGLAIALCGIAAFYYHDLYDLRLVRTFGQSARRVPQAAAVGGALLLAGHAPFTGCALEQKWLVVSGATALGLVMLVRMGAYRLMATTPGLERVLVIGGGALAQELIAEIEARPDLRQRVVGYVDDRAGTPPPGCPRLGGLKDVAQVTREVRPQRAIIALASRRGSMPLKALLDLRVQGTIVEDGVEVYERLTGKITIEALTPSSLIFSKHYRGLRVDLAVARALTLPASAIGLVLLAPLLGAIALAIKLDSPGPLFFVQERVGRAGKLFRLFKFRTMHPAVGVTSEWVRDNDARLTRVGRWLRRFRLDELPQLLNIVKGDMSLIGPRPHPVSNVPLFAMVLRNMPECGETIPYYALRSMVRPGLTGWAQVRYRYANDLEEEIEKMRYDLYYIKHMSLWLDLRILVETVKIVLRGHRRSSDEAGTRRPAPAPPAARTTRSQLCLAGGATPPLKLGLAAAAPLAKAEHEMPAPSPTPVGRRARGV